MMATRKLNDYADKNEAIQRLMAFVESKGKASAIAKAIGMSDNIFSNMIKRDTKPSSELLIGLASAFPDLDIHYILTGSQLPIVNKLKKELKEREEEITFQRAVVSKLAMPGKVKGATICPDVDKKLRRSGYNQVMQLARRQSRRVVFTPGRVQESPIAALASACLQRVRMQ